MTEALVLVDFVNDIVSPDGKLAKTGTPAHVLEQGAISNARRVLDAARERGTKVIFVRVCFNEGHPELQGLTAPFYAAHAANGWLVRGTWGTEFHADLQPVDGEAVVEKARVNPFSSPAFEEQLEGVHRIVLAGVATNLAIEETVRNGAARGLEITVLEDCCASNNAEMHQFAITQMFPKFATVSNSVEYLAQS